MTHSEIKLQELDSATPVTLVDLLRIGAANSPSKRIFTFVEAGSETASLTLSELDKCAKVLAVKLQRMTSPGERALLVLPHSIDYIIALFGSYYAGVVAVPSHPPHRLAKSSDKDQFMNLEALICDCQASVILSTASLRARIAKTIDDRSKLTSLRWLDVDTNLHCDSQAWTPPSLTGNSLCHLQYTSGSTSSPRGVMVSHTNMVSNLKMIAAAFGFSTDSSSVSWLPFFHDMGLSCILSAVYSGSHFIMMKPADFIRRPYRWLKTISDFSATGSIAPNFAYELCIKQISDSEIMTLNLSSWRTVSNGAEPVRAETLEEFGRRFAPAQFRLDNFAPSYGLAEATVLVAVKNPQDPPKIVGFLQSALENGLAVVADSDTSSSDIRKLCGNGKPIYPQTVLIVDSERMVAMPDGQIGEILVQGPNVTMGYWNNPKLTYAIFQASVDGHHGQFLRTGDVGFIHDGELFVTGRTRDLLIFRGRNFFPQDIERAVIQSSELVLKSAAFSVDGDHEQTLIVVCEIKHDTRSSLFATVVQLIRQAIFAEFELYAYRVIFVTSGTIPLTSSGKIQRYLCRQHFLTESFQSEALFFSDSAHLENDSVAQNHHYLFKYDENPQSKTDLEALGVDSLDLARLAYELEKLYPNFEHDKIDLTALYRLTLQDCYYLLSKSAGETAEGIFNKLVSSTDQVNYHAIIADAQLGEIGPLMPTGNGFSQDVILLTGATGFVGAHILHQIIKSTNSRIQLLVRSHNANHARSRVKQNLQKYKLLNPLISSHLESRAEYLSGDLEQQRFGLSNAQCEQLSNTVDTIIHNGAAVNYVVPYSRMKAANVDGTREVLRLANTCRAKAIHYISSTIVHGWAQGPVLEADRNSAMNNVDFGYAESKWGAEQLVWQAIDYGLSARIYRPAMLTASYAGQFSRDDVTAALLLYFIKNQICINMTNQVSLMPVDFFAKRLVDFMLLSETDGCSFNMTMQYANLPQIADSMTRQFGYQFKLVTLEEFSGHLREHCKPGDLFFPFVNFYHRHYRDIAMMSDKRYVRTSYDATSIKYLTDTTEPTLDETVAAIVGYFKSEGLVS